MIYSAIKKLVTYGVETGLIDKCEEIYTTNLILDVLGLSEYEDDGKEDRKSVV